MSKLLRSKKSAGITLVGLCIIVLVMTAGLLAINVLTDQAAEASNGADSVVKGQMVIDTSEAYARELYACKVDDVNDTAAVAKILSVMKLEDLTGKFTVKISDETAEKTSEEGKGESRDEKASEDGKQEKEVKVLSIAIERAVQEQERKDFDADIHKYAQQMLALLPDIDKIEWSYPVISPEVREETAVVSLNEAVATEELGEDIRDWGSSAARIQQLLIKQAEQ